MTTRKKNWLAGKYKPCTLDMCEANGQEGYCLDEEQSVICTAKTEDDLLTEDEYEAQCRAKKKLKARYGMIHIPPTKRELEEYSWDNVGWRDIQPFLGVVTNVKWKNNMTIATVYDKVR